MKTTPILIVALLVIGAMSARADITITDTSLEGLSYQTPGPGATAAYVGTMGGDYAYLTSPDNVPGGSVAQIEDTGLVVVDNGYDGATLGTLSFLVAQGAGGHVSFNNLSEGGLDGVSTNGQYAYWDILLTDPTNVNSTVLLNAY